MGHLGLIIVDTSVWVDRLHRPDATLDMHVRKRTAMMHPMALGELACGMFSDRDRRFRTWRSLPRAPVHDHDEVVEWIESERLMGRGIGFIDAHLLYSTVRRPGTRLWTHDKRLEGLARRFGVAHPRRD